MREEETGRVIHTAGWPRSGNNWTVRILSDLLGAPITYYGESPDAQFAQVIRPGYTVNMTHYGAREFEKSCLNGNIIFVVRDPRDITVSFRHFYHLKTIKDTLLRLKSMNFVDYMLDWSCVSKQVIVRYEDWHNDFISTAMACHYHITTPKQETSIANCERVKKRQAFDKWTDRGDRVMRKGIVGDWKNEFSEEDAKLAHNLFWPILKEYLYEDENDYQWWQRVHWK